MTKAIMPDAASEGFAHQYIRVDEQRIHCSVLGDGEPVLLIPGWPQTWYAWRHTMAALAESGFRAIAVDPIGAGHSARPDHGYDTGSAARALHRLMIQFGYDRYRVAGHDVGM